MLRGWSLLRHKRAKENIKEAGSYFFLLRRGQALVSYFSRRPFLTALIFILTTWFVIAALVFLCENRAEDRNIRTPSDALWWGIVTLLTVGYGDRYPVTGEGRFLAALLMIAGVGGIAVVTAKISSYFLERALRERRGFVDTEMLRGHYVVCGWKEEMIDFLLHVLECNRGVSPSNIILVNNAPDSEIANLLEVPRLKGIRIIKGDFFLEINLKRAAPERAQKIILLVDATPNAQGQIPTPTEADARTIMTAMTLNNIAKGIPVVAEILDASVDHYLRIAHVNEIVYSRNYSRLILAMSSAGLGLTNVFHELLNPTGNFVLSTREIPMEFLNRPYENLVSYYRTSYPQDSLIGLLENSGNSHVAKEKAIRQAQQTPNISQLVQNLQGVKSMKFNLPRFGIPNEYTIKDGSMAILIEYRGEKQNVA